MGSVYSAEHSSALRKAWDDLHRILPSCGERTEADQRELDRLWRAYQDSWIRHRHSAGLRAWDDIKIPGDPY
jgi:hypothetical protein